LNLKGRVDNGEELRSTKTAEERDIKKTPRGKKRLQLNVTMHTIKQRVVAVTMSQVTYEHDKREGDR